MENTMPLVKCVETLIVRNIGPGNIWRGDLEVFLRYEGSRDYYTGLWALPHMMCFPQEPEQETLDRLGVSVSTVCFKESRKLEQVERVFCGNKFEAHVYRCFLNSEPDRSFKSYWFTLSELPRDMVPGHRMIVERWGEEFRRKEQQYAITG